MRPSGLVVLIPLPHCLPLFVSAVDAEALGRHDEVHRIDKRPRVTRRALLGRRDDVCGASMRLCPSSLDGNCCPDNYDCAKESCYATTKGPSTCGTKVGWYACAAVYGGGCCPDGYVCQRAALCVPPSGSPYTYGCPSSQYLCPSSMSYGCCPSGMGCAISQCYATGRTTVTRTVVMTTTERGRTTEYTTTATAVGSPEAPTGFLTVDHAGGDRDPKVLKYFPAAIPKVTPSEQRPNSSGGISARQIGGIVAGSVCLVAIAVLAALVLLRKSKRGGVGSGIKPNSQMTQRYPAESDLDTMSVDPLMMSPEASRRRASLGVTSTRQYGHGSTETPTISDRGFPSAGSSQDTNTGAGTSGWTRARGEQDADAARIVSYMSHGSRPAHRQHLSDVSDSSSGADSDAGVRIPGVLVAELEARPYVAELPDSTPPVDEPRRPAAQPAPTHQRKRSDGRVGATRLDVVDEELDGYHGPSDGVVGRTATDRSGRTLRQREAS